jgi:hypothetical protein
MRARIRKVAWASSSRAPRFGYSVRVIRRLVAVAAAGVLTLSLACGGAVFTAASHEDDASTDDGPAIDGPALDGRAEDGMDDGSTTDSPTDTAAAETAADVIEETPAHCGGDFQCIPAVPVGWAGPTDLYLGAAPAPACPGASTDSFDGMEGLQAAAAACDCECGPPEVTCGSASVTTSTVKGCGTQCATATPALDTCFAAPADCLTLPTMTGTFQTLTVSVTSATCSPQSTVGITPPTWKTYARACASPLGSAQGDCLAGQVCARTPSDPFQPVACIVQAGAKACPVDGYTQLHTEYTGVTDTRACTECTCGASGKAQCTGTLYAYAATTNGTCGGMADIYDPAVCVPTNLRSDMKVEAVGSGAACVPSAVTPSGTSTPSGTTTICCTE